MKSDTSSPDTPSPADVRDNHDLHRFELAADGAIAFLKYVRGKEVIILVHTEVPEVIRDRGIGSALVKGALDLVRRQGMKAVAKCGFVVSFLRAHPEYQDLLAAPLPEKTTP